MGVIFTVLDGQSPENLSPAEGGVTCRTVGNSQQCYLCGGWKGSWAKGKGQP